MPLRRDTAHGKDFADEYAEGFDSDRDLAERVRRPGIRLSFRGGLLPRSLWGRIAAVCALLALTGAAIAFGLWVQSFLLHDEHFLVPDSDAIQIDGNSNLTRAQLLSVFGEDVDRNVFNIPLAERRTELESLPWVQHATVMRLLPNHVRVAIIERTPVAFVRQGSRIGLVDANGVLFDLPTMENEGGAPGAARYSFPVLTGIAADDALSTRAARMKIYTAFLAALDAEGEGISHQVSEVNLSNPDDVQAIIPDAKSPGADILIHFGEEKFLERYHQFQQHLPEWRTQYPKLGSVDMRYEQQVVLQMQPGTTVPAGVAASAGSDPPATAVKAATPKMAKPHLVPTNKKVVTKTPAASKIQATGKPVDGAVLQGATR